MLKKVPNPKFTVPVNVRIPGGVMPIKVTYHYFSPEDWQTVVKGNPEMTYEQALEKVVDSWEGPETPFSLAELADYKRSYPGIANAMFNTFFNEIHGAALLGN